jgi:predicted ABC-type transport system involved in lysophospholipase L1 biosynthesis ATPase subunit
LQAVFLMGLLEFRDVGKRYRDGEREIAALDGVSLEVEEGDFVGVRGRRRSGKSTLLQVAAGLLAADSGQVRVCDVDLGGLGESERVRFLRGRVGIACADWRPHRQMSVVDYVAMPLLSGGGVSPRSARIRARKALERVGGLAHGELSTSELSLGEMVRAGVAQALVAEPLLLLVDEPPVLRSPSEGRALYQLLDSLGSDPGLALVVASEDLELAQRAPRLLSISNGKVRVMVEPGTIVPFPERRTDGGRSPS